MVEVVTGWLRSLVDALVYGFAQVSSLLKNKEQKLRPTQGVGKKKEGINVAFDYRQKSLK